MNPRSFWTDGRLTSLRGPLRSSPWTKPFRGDRIIVPEDSTFDLYKKDKNDPFEITFSILDARDGVQSSEEENVLTQPTPLIHPGCKEIISVILDEAFSLRGRVCICMSTYTLHHAMTEYSDFHYAYHDNIEGELFGFSIYLNQIIPPYLIYINRNALQDDIPLQFYSVDYESFLINPNFNDLVRVISSNNPYGFVDR